MASLEDQEPTLELINKEITDALSRQTTVRSQLDTKAALLAGVAATAAQFLAGRKDPSPQVVLAALAYVSYAVTFGSALAAYAVAKFRDVPDPRGLVRECVKLSKAQTLAHLVATRVGAYEANQRPARRKVVFWWISVGSLTMGVALSTAALVLAGPPVPQPAVAGSSQPSAHSGP